jgi:hypothetical protein
MKRGARQPEPRHQLGRTRSKEHLNTGSTQKTPFTTRPISNIMLTMKSGLEIMPYFPLALPCRAQARRAGASLPCDSYGLGSSAYKRRFRWRSAPAAWLLLKIHSSLSRASAQKFKLSPRSRHVRQFRPVQHHDRRRLHAIRVIIEVQNLRPFCLLIRRRDTMPRCHARLDVVPKPKIRVK